MTEMLQKLSRLRTFVTQMTNLVDRVDVSEPFILDAASDYLKELVAQDDWLPDVYAQCHPEYYQQYLLHCDPQERFSIVSFVWGPGQKTPVHDHCVWGLVGMLRGVEQEQQYTFDGKILAPGKRTTLNPGEVATVSPADGDIHQVSNAYKDRVSISIHVYGANIGRVKRHVFSPETGEMKEFISGYANAFLPNLWTNVA